MTDLTPTVTDRRQRSTTAKVLAILVTVCLGIVPLLPWMIAVLRGKANSVAVFWISLLLCWTIVGWIVALIMACAPHHRLTYRSGPDRAGYGDVHYEPPSESAEA